VGGVARRRAAVRVAQDGERADQRRPRPARLRLRAHHRFLGPQPRRTFLLFRSVSRSRRRFGLVKAFVGLAVGDGEGAGVHVGAQLRRAAGSWYVASMLLCVAVSIGFLRN
jgi:hypothetical protein